MNRYIWIVILFVLACVKGDHAQPQLDKTFHKDDLPTHFGGADPVVMEHQRGSESQ